MNRLDRLVIKELIGPWVFGVMMFTVLIVAASYLFKASDYLVQGVGGFTVFQFLLLNLPGVMVKTFAMAMLLAGLLAFGRLSSDSEIVAIRAAGVSVYRIVRPVALFSILVAGVAFVINETVVPWASMKTLEMQAEIAKNLNAKSLRPTSYPVTDEKDPSKLAAYVTAQDFDIRTQTLRGALVTSYGPDGAPSYQLYAKELEFDPGQVKEGVGWRIRGGAEIRNWNGTTQVRIDNEAWPPQVPTLTATPLQLLTDNVSNLDVFSMRQIREEIRKEEASPNPRKQKIGNYWYGYWNKIALPLAALIYGLLGAPLGIRNARTGTAAGFALSVAIIFGYVTLANTLNIYAMNGVMPAYVASFSPLIIGLIASGIIMWRRNA